jgi:hypothetical protein
MNPTSIVARWHLRKAASKVQVSGSGRAPYAQAVWDMYLLSYKSIGYNLANMEALLADQDTWTVFLGEGGTPIAFAAYKTTPYGLKGVAAGTDGSAEGKSAIKSYKRSAYHQPGYYSEVSHAMEHITSE